MEVVERVYREVDVYVTQGVYALLRNVFATELTSTPTTKGLPTVDSPTPIVIGVTLYLTTVIAGLAWIKAKDLKPRSHEPLLMQAWVLLHNLFCFALSLYMCVCISYQAITHKYTLWGNAYNPKHTEMATLVYMFYMSKYVEFFDTVRRIPRLLRTIVSDEDSKVQALNWTFVFIVLLFARFWLFS